MEAELTAEGLGQWRGWLAGADTQVCPGPPYAAICGQGHRAYKTRQLLNPRSFHFATRAESAEAPLAIVGSPFL